MSDSRRHELLGEGEVHPSPEDITGLLEADSAPQDAERLFDHLKRCRRCFGLYAEIAETQLAARLPGAIDEVPADLIREAKALAVSIAGRHGASDLRIRRLRGFRGAALSAIGVATLIVAAFLTWRGVSHPGRPSGATDASVLEPIRLAVREASRTDLVLGADIAPAGPHRRGDASADPLTLSRALNRLAAQYDQSAPEETAYWLAAGMLAEGDPDVRAILNDAQARFPGSPRIANLSAVLDYRENRLPEADRKLSTLLDRQPEDAVALFNRAYVLKELGRDGELARLREVLDRTLEPGTPLRLRAESELDLPPR